MTNTTPDAPAKRGDIVAVSEITVASFMFTQQVRQRVMFATVTSVSRVGAVKVAIGVDGETYRIANRHTVLVLPAAIDGSALMAAAAKHTYPGGTQVQPFASTSDAREFARPFLGQVAA